MIVGRGLLARAFTARYGTDPSVTIFASGVSNSQETGVDRFARERALLAPFLDGGTRLVYFGSCASVMDGDTSATPYMRHKRAMEELVVGSPDGLVLRLPQVVGPTQNPNTLTNFLRDHILNGSPFTVWANAERNLIDVDDVVAIGTRLIDTAGSKSDRAFSVASADPLPMPAIISIFEHVLGRKAICSTEPLGGPLRIDAAEAFAAAGKLGIDLGRGYAEAVIRKYYEPHT